MQHQPSLKSFGARHYNNNIYLLAWSDKSDMMAYSNDKGEVVVQRLNWQKVFTLPPPQEKLKVRSICWQPSETNLAVAYSNGQVGIVDLERQQVIHTVDYKTDIWKAYFSPLIHVDKYSELNSKSTELPHETFLPFLPKLNNLSVTNRPYDPKSFIKEKPCFLVIILKNGRIYLRLFASFEVTCLDITKYVQSDNFEVADVYFNREFDCLYVIVRDGYEVKLLHFRYPVLKENMMAIMRLATQCGHVHDTRKYIDGTVQNIIEAWETVLLEMDNKLTRYANHRLPNNLSADFLELLVFGYASNEIEEFLIRDVTEKEIKKLQTSVELSFSTVQTLIYKSLNLAVTNLFYFMSSVKGMARNSYFFENLLTAKEAEDALCKCGALVMKVQELQQILGRGARDMNLFFSWLHLLIFRLTHDDMSENMTQLSPTEIMDLADFLYSLGEPVNTTEGTPVSRKFNLEKFGQYLRDADLHHTFESIDNDMWDELLNDNNCLYKSKLLFPLHRKASLLRARKEAFKAIDAVFERSVKNMSQKFILNSTIKCGELNRRKPIPDERILSSLLYRVELASSDLLAISVDRNSFYLLELNRPGTQAGVLLMDMVINYNLPRLSTLIVSNRHLRLIGLEFTNEEYITILFKDTETPGITHNYLINILLFHLLQEARRFNITETINLEVDYPPEIIPITDCVEFDAFVKINGQCTNMCLSRPRQMITFVSDNRKKLSIFSLEAYGIERGYDSDRISPEVD